MSTTTTTQPSHLETVTLGQAKTHLRVSSQGFDGEVEAAIEAAVDWCEHYTGRTLRTTVEQLTRYRCWVDIYQSFPAQPVIDIVSVKYFDADDAEQTVDPSNYRLIKSDGGAAKVELVSDFVWPGLAKRSDAVQIAYTTGYPTSDDIPPRAKQAIKMMLNVYYGDLSPKDIEVHERQAKLILDSLDWGAYR